VCVARCDMFWVLVWVWELVRGGERVYNKEFYREAKVVLRKYEFFFCFFCKLFITYNSCHKS